jgi:CDP-diacylglycerol--glycerol-3-phosphate 3-phosphatidyltransferase
MLTLPLFLTVRMAMNAADGMLAREFGQKSNLGAYLNEIGDVVSDSFLFLPFAYVAGFSPVRVGAVIVLSVISELTGVTAVLTGASRRYDGPMGESDRALAFGALSLWIGLGFSLPRWAAYSFSMALCVMLAITILNRVRKGLAEVRSRQACGAL